jgi:hypothetical protein
MIEIGLRILASYYVVLLLDSPTTLLRTPHFPEVCRRENDHFCLVI